MTADLSPSDSAERCSAEGGNVMKKLLMLTTTAVVGLGALIGPAVANGPAVLAQNVNEGVCQPQDQHIPGENRTSIVVDADPGEVIIGYCVKAGSINQETENGTNGPVYKSFDPGVTSVTITYPGGKQISHYVVFYADAPPPPAEATPVKPTTTPTCAAVGTITLPTTVGVDYSQKTNEDGTVTVTATAQKGYVLVGYDGPWTLDPRQLTGATCTTNTPPPVVNTPTPTPTPAVVVVAAAGPVPAVIVAAAPVPAAAPSLTALPATGSSSWTLFFTALGLLAAGFAALRISRRPGDHVA